MRGNPSADRPPTSHQLRAGCQPQHKAASESAAESANMSLNGGIVPHRLSRCRRVGTTGSLLRRSTLKRKPPKSQQLSRADEAGGQAWDSVQQATVVERFIPQSLIFEGLASKRCAQNEEASLLRWQAVVTDPHGRLPRRLTKNVRVA